MLSTQARVFTRSVTLSSVAPAAERRPARLVTHGNVTWVHADEAMAAPTVTFPLPESIEGDLFLIVEEGDNQPLPIDKATHPPAVRTRCDCSGAPICHCG